MNCYFQSQLFELLILSYFIVRLLNNEGALLAFSGYGDKDARVTAAIASNIWEVFEKNGKTQFYDDQLDFVVLECTVRI